MIKYQFKVCYFLIDEKILHSNFFSFLIIFLFLLLLFENFCLLYRSSWHISKCWQFFVSQSSNFFGFYAFCMPDLRKVSMLQITNLSEITKKMLQLSISKFQTTTNEDVQSIMIFFNCKLKNKSVLKGSFCSHFVQKLENYLSLCWFSYTQVFFNSNLW